MSAALKADDYKVAWIAILPVEIEAAIAALDRRHEGHFSSQLNDDYTYIAGEINGHNIVIAKPPGGQNYGPVTAAALAATLRAHFPIWFALLVGVAAGLPNWSTTVQRQRRRDIRLGDVLVCMPDKTSTGVIQYDLGTDTGRSFQSTSRLAGTHPLVRSAIIDIHTSGKAPFCKGNELANLLDQFLMAAHDGEFDYPGQDEDELFEADDNIYKLDDDDWFLVRHPRDELELSRVWYGNVGSGGTLMRNASRRDRLRDEYDLIGLEMEAAGVMNVLPVGVIRGVCDYGDAYKTKQWQPYAAAVAAVYAKALLNGILPQDVPTATQQPQALPLPGQPNPTAYRYPLPRDRMSYFGEQLKERTGRFGGRNGVLDLLKSATEADRQTQSNRIIALTGFTGIGKTEILLEYGLMARTSNHIFYCQAIPGQSFEACLGRLADAVGSEVLQPDIELSLREERWHRYTKSQRIDAFIQWLRIGPEGTSLILFDDVDAFKNDDNHDALSLALRSWPHTVLLTTRNPNLGRDLAAESSRDIDSHCVERLPENELIPIMEQFVDADLPITSVNLSQIAQLVDGHAMAACRAVQFISQELNLTSGTPVEDFISRFRFGTHHEMRQQFIHFEPYAGRSLAECFRTSIERAGGVGGTAARLLGFVAYLDDPDIDFRFVLRNRRIWMDDEQFGPDLYCNEILDLSDATFREALRQLVATSALIKAEGKLTVHHLMQEYIFHEQGHAGRRNHLRQILLLASSSICLDSQIPTFLAVIRRCGLIAASFKIRFKDIVPMQETLQKFRFHTENPVMVDEAQAKIMSILGMHSR